MVPVLRHYLLPWRWDTIRTKLKNPSPPPSPSLRRAGWPSAIRWETESHLQFRLLPAALSLIEQRIRILARICVCFAVIALLPGCAPSNANVNQEPAIQPANVQVVQPHRGEISRSVTLPANIRAYQQATLYAKVAGYLKSISVDRGDLVKAGDMLAEVEVPELLAEQARFKAEVDVAKVDYERVSQAMKKAVDLVMPQTVDEAKAKYEIAMANLKRNETLLDYAKIVAPFSGVITRRWVDPGALIPSATSSSAPQNAAVVTLMDFSKVRIDVAVPEQETPLVKNDLPVKITVEELPGKAFAGKVTRFAYALDDMTKTMDAEIEMPNPNQELRPGMFATAKIAVQRKHDALLMPIEALVSEKSKTSVFTLVQNKAKKVLVKIGFNDGAMAEIVEGLNGDEMVILPGKMSLNDGQPVNVADVARGK